MKSVAADLNRQFFRGNLVSLILGIFQSLVIVAVNLVISWLLQQILDIASGEQVNYTLLQLVYVSLGIVGVIVFAMAINYHAVPKFLAKAMAQYKNYVYETLSKKSISAFNAENTSTYISALSNDANTIETDYLANIFNLNTQIMLFAGAFIMMLCYSPVLTLVSVILTLIPIIASVLAGGKMAKAEEEVSRKNQSFINTLKDSLVGFSVIKSFKAERQMCKLISESVCRAEDAKCKRRKISITIEALGLTAGYIAQIGVFIVGAWMAISGRGVTAGVVILFTQLMNFVTMPVSQVPQMLAKKKAAKALINKLASALTENVREERDDADSVIRDGITMKNVTFSYDGKKKVLSDFNCFFAKGKSYALVGGSGSGKTTILNLLMGGNDYFDGEILYDDKEIRAISSKSLYDLVSLVQQNVFVFNNTIINNITMFNDFDAEAVKKAVDMSGLSELVRERGEQFLCGENGSGLSGGEVC